MESFLLLIDGSSLLTTQFFGNLPREILYAKTLEEKELYFHKIMMTTEGVYTNAVYGFLRTLMKILKEQKPSHLAVAWDLSRDTFRREIYADYKANRGETLEPLKQQFALCQEVLKNLSIVQFMDDRYEADDFCGTLAARFEQEIPVRILTKDNDYLQLVTDRTRLWLMHSTAEKTDELFRKYHMERQAEEVPERAFCFTPELVEQEFGVPPCHINSLKGLMGDSSDNIKGVAGIGPVTAVKLIQEYGTMEKLYEAIDSLDAEGEKRLKELWKEKLGLKRSPLVYLKKQSEEELVGRKAAFLSEELATIKRDIPLEIQLDDLKTVISVSAWHKELERLQMKSLKVNFGEEEEQREVWPRERFVTVTDYSEAELVVNRMLESPCISMAFAADREHFLGMALCDGRESCFLAVHFFLTEELLLEWAAKLVRRVPLVLVQEEKPMLHWLRMEESDHWRDLSVAAYLLDPLTSNQPYELLASRYLDWQLPGMTELLGKHGFEGHEPLEEAVRDAACCCVVTAWLAWPVLKERLQEQEMLELYETMELPLIQALYDMEREGILVKSEELEAYGESLVGEIHSLERDIHELAGSKFNILSPKQLGEVLFDQLKLPFAKKTRNGYSTSADILDKLAPDYPIVEKVLQYRQLTKLKSTYADGLRSCISSDGRIHGTFNQTITATGRISSTEPNLQNIPVRMELGRAIRRVFVPREGYVFVDADYSQIELRILAHLSQDEQLIAAYRHAQDIHTMTASQVFHVPMEEVTPLMRRNAKAVNFGIVYGISAFGLSEDLSITRKEALDYMEQYFATYPKVKQYLDSLVQLGYDQGAVRTLYGRIRPIPELKSSNYMQRQFGERVAMNSPIQGTAADIMKIAMLRVRRRLMEENLASRIVLQVHDELLLETKKEEQEQVEQLLREEMEAAAQLSVRLEVSVSSGNSWYETK